MSSAFLHTSVYHWAKSASMSVICSTCFLFCAISISILSGVILGVPFYPPAPEKSRGTRTGCGQLSWPHLGLIPRTPKSSQWCSPPGRSPSAYRRPCRNPPPRSGRPPVQRPVPICWRGPQSSTPESQPAGRG